MDTVQRSNTFDSVIDGGLRSLSRDSASARLW